MTTYTSWVRSTWKTLLTGFWRRAVAFQLMSSMLSPAT